MSGEAGVAAVNRPVTPARERDVCPTAVSKPSRFTMVFGERLEQRHRKLVGKLFP